MSTDTYRLDAVGKKLWLGERSLRTNVSARTRRLVLERDGSRCQVCGIGSGEPYPGEPDTAANLTAGHRIPRERGGLDDLDNLRTECARCNEPMRHEALDPETLVELLAVARRLDARSLRTLLQWLQAGQRSRSELDTLYDRARKLSASERSELVRRLTEMLPS